MPEVRNFTQGAPPEKQNEAGMFQAAIHQITCPCGIALHVRNGRAGCLICERVYTVTIGARPMTPAEQRIAAAHLRGERLPAEEPTVTQKEGLR